MTIELDMINKEIRSLEAEKKRLEALRNAKLTLLKAQIGNAPSRFAAEHPIISSLVMGAGQAGKEAAKQTASTAKTVGGKLRDYVAWSQANPGKGWVAYLQEMEEKKKKLVKV